MSWNRNLRIALTTFAGALAGLYLFTLTMNPYGNFPNSVFARHVIMDDNQRFQYPAIVRSKRFDSIVIGTSTARLLEPGALESHFGGRFANLALNSGMAWEQYRLAKLFMHEVPAPKTLIVGLDWVWCAAEADKNRITVRGFPEWMFDDDPRNDYFYLLNVRALEIAGRRLAHALGLARPRWPDNGYEIFTPEESRYDLAKARAKIYAGAAPAEAGGAGDTTEPGPLMAPALEQGAWRFPALAWFDEIVADKRWERIIPVFMPVHVAAQPVSGSAAHAHEAECKRRIAEIAGSAGWSTIDFRIPSTITRRDDHYWDALHYRLGIAERVVGGIARALTVKRDDPGGDWRYLDGRNAQTRAALDRAAR